ncbi:MAG: DUF3365 domain-containing protein [Cyclobacteriaceae bacterium]|nr:DUF3365 domain-containing protein [Cyclobacteriaceae bacterium]
MIKLIQIRFIVLISSIALLASCSSNKQENDQVNIIPDSVYLNKGDKLVAHTFDTLRNSLLSAIGQNGLAYAIDFCNEKAYPLTALYQGDSITIRRSSARYRNPKNQPDSLEQATLAGFIVNGPSTKIIRTGNQVHYIKPIIMQAMCLNCHGVPDQNIKPETLQVIHERYPADQAINYAEGDLRGIWHIAFALKR